MVEKAEKAEKVEPDLLVAKEKQEQAAPGLA